MAIILISGGSGTIGTALTRSLKDQGHSVRHLSRSVNGSESTPTFEWDVNAGRMDDDALAGVDHIVHLAGAGIADKRWTQSRIEELIRSRISSARLLLERVHVNDIAPRSFVSAAGIGYYGAYTSDHIYKESDAPGTDVIGSISRAWEEAADEWRSTCRVVKIRTPVVLTTTGGALPQLMAPVRLGAGAPLGRGDQWMPWVHIDDLVRVYAQALENGGMEGAYNANPATDTTNAYMMRTLAKVMNKPYFLPPVPAFTLKLALGRMASVLLEGSRADNSKLLATGFRHEYNDLAPALKDLLERNA